MQKMVIENNVSTIARNVEMDHKFKSEGQGHKLSFFLKYVQMW